MKQMIREIYASYLLFWLTFTSRVPTGKNVFSENWDVLVILDACRTDALKEVSSEYEFIDGVDERWSLGSTSKEWIENTFVTEYEDIIGGTAYITGNPFSNMLIGEHRPRLRYASTRDSWIESVDWAEHLVKDNLVDPEQVGHVEALWGDTNGNFSEIQQPPTITDYTIEAARNDEYDRVIAHYMQPHQPYFSTSDNYNDLEYHEKNPIESLRDGNSDEVWEAYLDNLRYVLDYVETLVENVDGTVAITADHGELMGELGMYSHWPGNPHPKLRKVPWTCVDAEDTQSLNPDVTLGERDPQAIGKEQLEALGYL